jgi:hypothetical protein
MPLSGGTAFHIVSPALDALHAEMVERLHGVLTVQDRAPRKLHVTVQNKVPAAEAKALQVELAQAWMPNDFAFAGLSLHRFVDGRWDDAGTWRFRGAQR